MVMHAHHADRRHDRRRGFTLFELAILVVALGLLIAVVVMPIIDPPRRTGGRPMENSARIKGIHSGLILYAQGNNDRFPGLNPDGSEAPAIAPSPRVYGSGGATGFHPANRYAVLMNNNYFTPEYARSPAELGKVDAQLNLVVTAANYSHAMLRLDAPPSGRVDEWAATTNSQAPVISDRNLSPRPGAAARSIHGGGSWRGSVGYNDNHVEFTGTNLLTTFYTGGAEMTADDLFAEDTNANGEAGFDAAMVYHDPVSYTNQR